MRVSTVFAAGLLLLFAASRSLAADSCVIRSGSPDFPVVALTFDDGPHPEYTERILDALDEAGARATFFVVGRRVEAMGGRGGDLLRRMIRSGHEIGNHTFSHSPVDALTREGLRREIERTQSKVEEHCGIRPTLFRPPGGAISDERARAVIDSDIRTVVLWSLDTADWKGLSNEALWTRVARDVRPGSIILLHDIHRRTLRSLPLLIDLLQARGFRLGKVSEVIQPRE